MAGNHDAIPILLPPDELGLYVIRFYAALDSALASKPAAC